eukprot:9931994-Lingulodinium_polyedra.AAC.1
MSSMYEHNRPEFDKYVCGPSPLSDFWNHLDESHPWMLTHPVRLVPNYRNCAVPLRLHGDGVPIGKGQSRSLDAVSM